jgi:hypothetical protein
VIFYLRKYNKMPEGKEVLERKRLFYEFCNFACHDFVNETGSQLAEMPLKLKRSNVDLVLLVSQAKAFRKKYPYGVEIRSEIPVRPNPGGKKGLWQYKQKIVKLLKEYTGIEFEVSSIIPCRFYEDIINDVKI